MQTGKTESFVMIFVASLKYATEHYKDMGKLSYFKRPADYDGMVLFYELEKGFVNGWRYEDGKITKTIRPSAGTGSPNAPLTRGDYERVCTTTWVWVSYVVWVEDDSLPDPWDWDEELGYGTILDPVNARPLVPEWVDEYVPMEECEDVWVPDPWDDEDNGGYYPPTPPTTPPTPPTNPATPKAKKIFRNSNMTQENWELLERAIEKIQQDCMGKALYNELDALLGDKTFAIQFDLNAIDSDFDGSSIILNNFESNALLHEMFHAYQAYQEIPATYNGAVANLEVEACIAQYIYLKSLPEYTKGSKWTQGYQQGAKKAIAMFSDHYLSKNGTLKSPDVSGTAWSSFANLGSVMVNEYAKINQIITFDNNRSMEQNLKNLSNLSGGC